jgi:hypothetical protein
VTSSRITNAVVVGKSFTWGTVTWSWDFTDISFQISFFSFCANVVANTIDYFLLSIAANTVVSSDSLSVEATNWGWFTVVGSTVFCVRIAIISFTIIIGVSIINLADISTHGEDDSPES